ncbi:type I restriction-modification enzyme R subunit C-terminal domain-containing protein [Mycobacterium sp. 94-17]|uniref:type I restriction endonuclease subunit R n=1 Tax=Mycobacterium sp. 94-17 TaxID=2986147 RepID=UPI002D1F426F|nr:type I restriction-modification enzyme R subunit C-terminal domain-containing protein [Mycobacterium sp. 94-17]MEB4211299.1 DEAD/DEAH box helicase family protein [Mycobacterium sp. 94-17]
MLNTISAEKAVEEWPTELGPADYVLTGRGRLVGVVEAKKVASGPQGVLPQAERYARAIPSDVRYQGKFGVPFLYSTNGEEIWFHDVREPLNRSRIVSGFHTPEALRELVKRDVDAEMSALRRIPVREGIRPYQVEANTAIEQAIADRHRKMLVTMATGTGKTLMTVNEIYRLMKSGVARRVLFLVDRRALAAQTVRAFASFEAEPGLKFDKIYPVYSQHFQQNDFGKDEKFDPSVMPNSLLTDPKLGDAFVYVSTIQRMSINLFGREAGIRFGEVDGGDEDADALNIPIHSFDLIVADECHRGYSAKEFSVWRNTLDWFDAVKIGLTATPAAHTMAYFEHLVYRYDYERAVREGYLVDYDVVRIYSDVRMNGLFLNEGEQVDQVDPDTGVRQLDLLEDERAFDASQVERSITAPDSNRKILEEIRRYAEAHEAETGRFPKTLVFAANDLPHTSHADQLVALGRDIFGRGEALVAKITGRVDRPLQKIREFRNRPNPKIVVTVDLLTTGVDIPDLEFLVFLRPVKSRILFEQMLGRGTRRSTDLLPPKTNFVVFDCFDGTLIEYFRKTTGMTVEPPEGDGKPIRQIIEEIWQNRDRDYNTRRLVKRLQRIDKNMSGDARDLFARFIADGDIGRLAEELPAKLRGDFGSTLKILRDEDFLRLLTDYPRAERTFIVAPGVSDRVGSEWLIKAGIGKEYRPEDYLQLFQQFIEEHSEEIRAVGILLSRPQDWGADALRELREKLALAPEHFTEANLQRAFQTAHHKALVDIISMVKRAAMETAPLLTAEERVDVAFARVTANRKLTDEQAKWMEHIRHHLVQNLSIEREDFADIPVLADRGGWGRANRTFDGQLAELLDQLNEELVAA